MEPDFALTDASVLTVARSVDLAVAWTAGGGYAGSFQFMISQTVGPTRTSVVCSFPTSAGSGVVPASALEYLTPSDELDGGALGELGLQVYASQTVTVGGWTIVAFVGVPLEFGTPVNVENGDAQPPYVAGLSDDASACAAEVDGGCPLLEELGVSVSITCAVDTPPAMTGGTIVPGTYALVSEVDYFSEIDDAATCQATFTQSQTILLNAECMQIAWHLGRSLRQRGCDLCPQRRCHHPNARLRCHGDRWRYLHGDAHIVEHSDEPGLWGSGVGHVSFGMMELPVRGDAPESAGKTVPSALSRWAAHISEFAPMGMTADPGA
ncbi:MAG TPA: hypothetical protein VEP50_10275 [bacterium]|nr:hypothetical protein [bacterium]